MNKTGLRDFSGSPADLPILLLPFAAGQGPNYTGTLPRDRVSYGNVEGTGQSTARLSFNS